MKKLHWRTRNLVLLSIFTVLGVVFPVAFHAVGLGRAFLPMQFPILLGAFFLCPPYAVLLGVLTPVISALTTGMPPMFPNLPCLVAEFGAYALFVSLFGSKIKNKYLRLIVSLVLGKVILFVVAWMNSAMWGFAAVQLTQGLIGMAWQVVIVPALVKAVELAGVTRENI